MLDDALPATLCEPGGAPFNPPGGPLVILEDPLEVAPISALDTFRPPPLVHKQNR